MKNTFNLLGKLCARMKKIDDKKIVTNKLGILFQATVMYQIPFNNAKYLLSLILILI